MRTDNKKYILLKDGTYAVERTEWDSDSEKWAKLPDGKNFPDGISLKIFTNGDYEGGCDFAFSCDGHWYLY